jgi:threonine dehydratase
VSDENKLSKLELLSVLEAAERLKGHIHQTPLSSSTTFSEATGNEVFLKMENTQKTGSFKVRGATNKVAILDEDAGNGAKKLLVASSAGNHAQGLAYAADRFGFPATIVMPETTPLAKVNATKGYGANVVLRGNYYDDAFNAAQEIVKKENGLFVHPFDDKDIIAGQATVGLEILKQNPDIENIVVPAGGGGLLAGVSAAVKQLNPKVKVFGVQAKNANAVQQSFAQKSRVATETVNTIADGIAVKRPGELTTSLINRYADDVFTVSDDEIAAAILDLLEREKTVAEPSGATPLALLQSGRFPALGKKTACVLSGGNADISLISRIIESGLAARGRKISFSVVMNDKAGALNGLTGVIAQSNANITKIDYNRAAAEANLQQTRLDITCEVGGTQKGNELLAAIQRAGFNLLGPAAPPSTARFILEIS